MNSVTRLKSGVQIFFTIWMLGFSLGKVSPLTAGTLEDIRNKSGWQSPNHSERGSTYIPLLTPAELMAYLDKYHRDKIKMRVLFYGITARDLNIWVGPKNNRDRWPSTRYVSFIIRDPQGKVSTRDIRMFISKSNPDVDKLFSLSHDTPILITGRVRNIASGKAWIEVMKIDL